MPGLDSEGATGAGALRLGGWRVQPSLNRLQRGTTTVRVEPKLMDVLVFLAGCAGEVVSKDRIAAAVWPGVFVTDSVVTRAIAGLRRALEDDARAPRYIETIAKRGYRLLVTPAPTQPAGGLAAPPPGAGGVGQWVRGEGFCGREAEIAEVLQGPRNSLWLLGPRAIGKTSMLRQLEHLTAGGEHGYFPLFWDLQGCADPGELDADFHDALAEAEPRLAEIGLGLADVAGDDFLASLGRLRRALRSRGRTLLLLWDEVEELIHLHEASPPLLRKLRRALVSREGIRTVLAASSRLWRLAAQRDDTSPFLHGFAPPLYLGPLSDAAARRLVGRAADDGEVDAGTVSDLLRLAGNHPCLLQMLAAAHRRLGDLRRAADGVAADPTVRFFFAVDLDLLSELERSLVRTLARHPSGAVEGDLGLTAAPSEIASGLLHLERLGTVCRSSGDRLVIASEIFRRWLSEPSGGAGAGAAAGPDQKL